MTTTRRRRQAPRPAPMRKPAPSPENPTAADLYEAASTALAAEDLGTARLYLSQAAELGTADPDLAEEIGAALAEVGPPDAAAAALERAIALRPESGHAKFMYLGQVLGGEAGLAALRKGVALLEVEAADAAAAGGRDGAAASEAAAALAAGLCATAEAVLSTSGPDAGGAEVEALFSRAAAMDPTSPEPWQGLASLRVEQGRPEEARAALGAATSKWLPNLRAMMEALQADSSDEEDEDEDPAAAAARAAAAVAEIEARGGGGGGAGLSTAPGEDGGDADGPPPFDPSLLPPFEVRFEAAKLLLELEESTADAVVVCESLVAEADLAADAWYLLALALAAGGDGPGALEAAAAGRAALADPRAPPADADGAAFDDVEAAARELMEAGGGGGEET